jgi:glycogen debranching enzyme
MTRTDGGGLNLPSESAPLARREGTITLVEGSSFCLSDGRGDIQPNRPEGLFVGDTRILSRWQLAIDSMPPELLESDEIDPFNATFVARHAARSSHPVLVVRSRRLLHGAIREQITVRNLGSARCDATLTLAIGADFADLFSVKEGKPAPDAVSRAFADGRTWRYFRQGDPERGTEVWFSEAVTDAGGAASFRFSLPATQTWELTVEVAAILGGHRVEPDHPCGVGFALSPSQRLNEWRSEAPVVDSDRIELVEAVRRSIDDLGALRIFDPAEPDRPVIAAGAPWFMTLFGRDSLLTSWMALIVDPDLALAVLQTLARLQGTEVNPITEEEPGRILHEVRFESAASLTLGGGSVYYGTVDATPLFVMLLGELRRWGLMRDEVDALLPAADRAIEWIDRFGDRDGDGFVEYQRHTEHGLANQGWKDSWDGIQFADGTIADPPIAVAEAQGYTYAAYLARSYFAEEAGDAETAERFRTKAANLRSAFNREFWIDSDDGGYLALGLDRDKRKIDAIASNMGHALWTGILDADKAGVVARRLLAEDMFSGWGVRTLASSMGGYNPISYHCGSVWPHDSALIASGLMRYGFVDDAVELVRGLLEASTYQEARLPELFSGLSRTEIPFPVSYPSSCSPQAWASAAPLLCLRTLLRFDPSIPHGTIRVAPALPSDMQRLHVRGIPIAGSRIDVSVEGTEVDVAGLPPGIQFVADVSP